MPDTKAAPRPGQPAAAEPKPKRSRAKDDAPVVARAGGHVDRGDGNGWVLEGE